VNFAIVYIFLLPVNHFNLLNLTLYGLLHRPGLRMLSGCRDACM